MPRTSFFFQALCYYHHSRKCGYGTFFFLGSWRYKCMSLELLAVYMLLANVIFLIINIKNFDWKVKRMKSEAAFLPGMACAAFFLELIRGLN